MIRMALVTQQQTQRDEHRGGFDNEAAAQDLHNAVTEGFSNSARSATRTRMVETTHSSRFRRGRHRCITPDSHVHIAQVHAFVASSRPFYSHRQRGCCGCWGLFGQFLSEIVRIGRGIALKIVNGQAGSTMKRQPCRGSGGQRWGHDSPARRPDKLISA